jgi:TonB-linked SusC/RagA family outer membrane protein
MKKKQINEVWYDYALFKSFRIMRLTLGLLLIFVAQGWAKISYSQKAIVNLDMKNAALIDVLEEIEHQTDFFFVFNTEQVHSENRIDVKLSNSKIEETLNVILNGTSLKYSIKGRQIVISKEESNQTIGSSLPTSQQLKIINGTVADKTGIALPGVTVVVKGTTIGTLTESNGNFSLKIPLDAKILTFSFVGMKTSEVTISEKTPINVVMEEETIGIEEVVAIGYGTVKKSDLTGSVSSIKSAELKSMPTLRLDQALKGKISGLLSTATSSAPGAGTSIRIRGSNSISANNEPLYVVDGFIGGFDLNDINVDDIESLEVLKDASATAIYGSRGSNGVILITTKRGKEGNAKISFESYFSFQSPSRLIPVLNGSEFAGYMNEVKGSTMFSNPASYGEGTDWQNEVYRKNVPMTSITLSVSGGNAKNKYFFSGNYFNQEGISVNSSLERYHFSINTDFQLNDKLKIGNSLILSRKNYTPGSFGTPVIHVLGWQPTLPVRDAQGNFTIQTEFQEVRNDNPVGYASQSIDNTGTYKILGSIFGEFEILKGLTYKLNLGSNFESGKRQRYLPSTLYVQKAYQGTATINNSEAINLVLENTLNFSKNIGKHNIGGLLGYTRQKIATSTNMVEARTFVTDAFTYNNLAAGAERSNAGSNLTEEGLESFLLRTNYGLLNKYLFTISARLDGASVFAANNKWGFFPSAALAWKAENEEFIKNLKIFDNLKVRASIGRLGNPGLSPGASLSQLSQVGNNYIFGADQHVVSGIAANTLGNPDLKWESTTQFDIGFDAGFFNRRLQVTFDYYKKRTDNLLVEVPLLWLTSFSSQLTNYGTVTNNGLEFSLNSVNVSRKNFKWDTNFNISSNRNKVIDIIAPEGFILNNSFTWSGPSGILKEGEPIGTFYGLEMDGIWNSQEEITQAGVSGFSVFPGGRRFKDLDGNKIISATLDNTIIGHADPDFYGGLSNRFSYKGFELYLFFSFVYGNEIYNETGRTLEQALDNNVYRKFTDRWTTNNAASNIPSAAGIVRTYNVSNSSFVEDGSFVRLQDIRLSYNFHVGKVKWIQGVQLYVAGNNVLLFDKYTGYDPEINRGFDNTKRGYDFSQDPSLSSYTIGAKINF